MSTAAQINTELDDKVKNGPVVKLRGDVLNTIMKMITGSYYNKDTDYIKFKGVHRTDRVYAQDELAVRYGVLYVCLEDGVTGAWDATKWISYLDRNPGVLFGFALYSAATQFLTGQYTEYQHEIFRAKTDVMGTAPDPTQETDDWVKVPHQYNYGDTYRVGLYLDGSVIINNNIFYKADFGASYLESTDFATELTAAKWVKLSDDEAYTDAAISALLDGVAADGNTMAKLRALIQTNEDAIDALNTLLTSDNPALDDLQELVDAIEALQAFKETIDENSEIIAIIDAGVGDAKWRLDIESSNSTGNILFDKNRKYGFGTGLAIDGDITIDITGALEGVKSKMLHNDDFEPNINIPSGITITKIGSYIASTDNELIFDCIKDVAGDVKWINYEIINHV